MSLGIIGLAVLVVLGSFSAEQPKVDVDSEAPLAVVADQLVWLEGLNGAEFRLPLAKRADKRQSRLWAKMVSADIGLLMAQTRWVEASLKLESCSSSIDALIAALDRATERIKSLERLLLVLAGSYPRVASPPPAGAFAPGLSAREAARRKFYSYAYAQMLAVQNALVAARRAKEQLVARQQDALADLAGLKSRLAQAAVAVRDATKRKEELLESFLAEVGPGPRSAIAAGCRSKLIEALAGRVKGAGEAAVKARLPSRFSPPVAARPGLDVVEDGFSFPVEALQPVLSVAAGRVLFCDYLCGFGLTVAIQHGKSECTVFGHLAASLVRVGEVVRAGQRIAFTGESGLCQRPALFFGVVSGRRLKPAWTRVKWGQRAG